MARPQRQNADYFSHGANYRNDPKVRAVRNSYGASGYAVICMMLEILTDSDEFRVEWNDLTQEIYAGDMGVSAAEMRDVVNFCCRINLFSLDETGYLSCAKLTESLRPLVDKREFLRQKHREKEDSPVVSAAETPPEHEFLPQKSAETPQSIVEHSKVEKSKDLGGRETAPAQKNLGASTSLDLDDLLADFAVRMDNIPRPFVELWWAHYESVNWQDGGGKPVVPGAKIRFKWRNGKELPSINGVKQTYGGNHASALTLVSSPQTAHAGSSSSYAERIRNGGRTIDHLGRDADEFAQLMGE
jgi:hypothetical protein